MLNSIFSLQLNSNIHSKNTKLQGSKSKTQFSLVRSYPCDTVSFRGNINQNRIFFDDFIKQANKLELTPQKLISNISPENMIGEGHMSKVYNISGIGNYVLKIFKKAELNYKNIELSLPKTLKELRPVEDVFKGVNMGQEVGQLYGMSILVRQKGKEHSIKNWTYYVTNQNELTTAHAEKFLGDLENVSKMPDEAYFEFAKKIELLSKNNYKMDSQNPNNLLIDEKSINIVDYYYPSKSVFLDGCANSYFDMIGSILDSRLFEKYHNLLDKKQKIKLINASRTVVQKSQKAVEKTNLITDEQVYLKFLNDLDKYYGCDHKGEYNRLKNLVGKINIDHQ